MWCERSKRAPKTHLPFSREVQGQFYLITARVANRQVLYLHFGGRAYMEPKGTILFVLISIPFILFSISYQPLNFFLYIISPMNLVYVHMLVIYLTTEYLFTIFNILHLSWFVFQGVLVFIEENCFFSNNTENSQWSMRGEK